MKATKAESVSCVGYWRVSTTDQASADRTSPTDQRTAIERRARDWGRTVGKWFEDPGASGGTANRPGFRALLIYCERHPRPDTDRGVILMLNDSRFGRFDNPDEAAYYRFVLWQYGWEVRFVENDDTEDLTTRGVLRAIGSGSASKYRQSVKENARRGARGTASQGYWRSSEPLGYRREVWRDGKSTGKVLERGERKAETDKVKLVPHPREAKFIKELFTMYASGKTLTQCAVFADRHYPEFQWGRQTVRQKLMNRTYLGEVRCGDIVTPRVHTAIISTALFEQVQERLTENRTLKRSPAGTYMLSGLVSCACGGRYVGGGGSPRGPRGDELRYRIYKCNRGSACDVEPPLYFNRNRTERRVLEVIADVVTSDAVQATVAAALDSRLQAEGRNAGSYQVEIAKLEQKLARLVAAIADDLLKREEAAPQLGAIRAQLDTLREQRDHAKFAKRQAQALAGEKEELLAMARDFPGLMKRLAGIERRELIRPWLERAAVDPIQRTLTLTIRRLPALGSLRWLSATPGPS